MARKQSPTLTESELRLMNVLWERGPSTVKDVLDALPADPPLAYTTILTTLILLPFQDEPNDATLTSWRDQEESMRGWLRRLGRLFGKHKTFESFGKHWRYFCQQS